jgi:uncharacterized protein (TIGR02611 family)
MIKLTMVGTYRLARRIVIFVVGMTVLLIGIVMIVGPGPATIVIPLGLAILGIEFAWARRWLQKIKDGAKSAFNSISNRGSDKKPDA